MISIHRKHLLGIGLAILAFTADQATKQIALSALESTGSISVLPFFNLRLGFNEGVSFGMMADWFKGRPWALSSLMLAVVLVLAIWLQRAGSWIEALSLGVILGGALGNLVDRIRAGAVVDFLDFHWAGHHWPTFNVADIAIVGGSIGLVISPMLAPSRSSTVSGGRGTIAG